ncbi:glycosyltransferase [Maribius pontilimi]|uniref:Glycosyltransferase n=1 Tax=Palleronia pontilimi TaxID=1964209 RepID=A0A934IJZ0_9RHOB|nr:glycosyltransferase [Palleronia pontilimi]MBJ3764367.1 glycosyltransferase [Palleronia pontilimi]
MSNPKAFIRFKELLEVAQRSHDPDRDIREYALSFANRDLGIGLVRAGLTTRFGANLSNVFPNLTPVDDSSVADCTSFLLTGTIFRDPEHSHRGGVRLLNTMPQAVDVLFFETAFLATTHSWAHSFDEGKSAYACLGYVYDDIAYHFMADYPNRIIQKLNSDQTPTEQELARAETLLKRIVSQRISKYNAQPMRAPTMTDGYARRVLVCDQAYADASTVYGKVGEPEFERMLLAAIAENPDAEILVKTHPDSVWKEGKRAGYYAHLHSTGRVRMLRDPVNPYALFDQVDTVYVGTSQMGLEALFAGKRVVTFGVPFYAGWGLTDDRQTIPHRHRTRSLAEIFHYFYIWYTIYHLPDQKGPAEIEDVLSYIEQNRPYPLPPTDTELAAPPKVSVIIPVYGVEKYIEECIASVQRQTLREIEIIPINDASPDGSQAIIDRLAAEDLRIKPVVLSQNIGQGFARNRALEAARGDYVWFLDSDDWLVDPEFLEKTVQTAEQNGADMTRAKKAGEAIYDENDKLLRIDEDVTERVFSDDVPVTDYRSNPDILHSRHFCLWLYRRDFIGENDIRFVTTHWEERAFLLKALLRARTISLTTNKCFMYRIRRNSTARRNKNMGDVEKLLQNFEHICTLLKDHGAVDRDDDLRMHLNFQISQFVSILFFGFWYRTLIREAVDTEPYFRRIATSLEMVDFQSTDITNAPEGVWKDRFNRGVYHMIITALRSGRSDWLNIVVNDAPVAQAKLYETLLAEPSDAASADLQAALSRYARNDMVAMSPAKPGGRPRSKPRIVIHIGATKTGSTFLQHMLEKNRPALLREGVWFPEIGLFWQQNRPHKQAGHAAYTRAARDGDPAIRDHIERGLALMDGRIHTIILSSEAFFLQENSRFLADYFKGYDVEIVVYLRRQDEWANSQYCEFVAGGAVGRTDLPIDKWLALSKTRKLLDYRIPLQKWSDKIGKENVHVRVFEPDRLIDGDLLADFADATGLPQLLDLPRPDARDQNEARLSAAHVEVLRLFNTRPFTSDAAYLDFIEEVGTGIAAWRQERDLPLLKPWVLSAEQAETLMQEWRAANDTIAHEYLYDDKPLFDIRKRVSESASVQQEEVALIEQIYARHAPKQDAKPASAKRSARPSVQQVPASQYASPLPTPPRLVNYGLFGWRLWLLTPILAVFYGPRLPPERFQEFLTEPFDFSRRHWILRRPLMTGLLYPGGNFMGPGGIFRLWVPIVRKLIDLTGRTEMRIRFDADPIAVTRDMNSRIGRAVGRLMFPIGELRRH